MKYLILIFILCFLNPILSAEETTKPPLSKAEIWNSLNHQEGVIKLPRNLTLTVPKDFYFINTADSQKIFVDLWEGYPVSGVFGCLVPKNFLKKGIEPWVMVISYDPWGYMADNEATTIDYDQILLTKQQKYTGEDSFKDWALAPTYNQNTHTLFWGQEIKYGFRSESSFTYYIRVLGREGIIKFASLAYEGKEEPLDQDILDTLAQSVTFNNGYNYNDFDDDFKAIYGFENLILGKRSLSISKSQGFSLKLLPFILSFAFAFLMWYKRYVS